MWGKPSFYLGDSFAVEVRSLDTARVWYKERLGLRDARQGPKDDSGRPFVDLEHSDGIVVRLVEVAPGAAPQTAGLDPRPILFTRNVQKVRDWMASRGIAVDAITSDSGGNQLFHFHDLDGNSIEVCKEP